MNEEIRFGAARTEEDIHTSSLPESFKALAEEVRKRNLKKQTSPVQVPQKLSLSEFNTAMVHFYRGEVARSNIWRNRLDAT